MYLVHFFKFIVYAFSVIRFTVVSVECSFIYAHVTTLRAVFSIIALRTCL